MKIETFLQQLTQSPDSIGFNDTMAVIEANYAFTLTAFHNGKVENVAGQNSGSCKIFSFAHIHQLSAALTLHCFGDYYRKDVLLNPEAEDHQNIRQFIGSEWSGIYFEGKALIALG